MARTTKSRGKTKTTKKLASRAAARSTRSASVKRAANKPKVKVIKGWPAGLKGLHIASLVFYAALIVAAVLYMKTASFPLSWPLMSKDPILNDSANLVAASKHMMNFNLQYITVAVLGISALVSAYYLSAGKRYYQSGLAAGRLGWKKIEEALIGFLTVSTVAVLSGWQDEASIKLIALAFASIAYLGWLYESRRDRVYITGIKVIKGYLVLLIAGSAVATVLFGGHYSPWYVYVLYAGLVGAFISYTVNYSTEDQDYVTTERNNLILNLIVRGGFAVVLILGLLK